MASHLKERKKAKWSQPLSLPPHNTLFETRPNLVPLSLAELELFLPRAVEIKLRHWFHISVSRSRGKGEGKGRSRSRSRSGRGGGRAGAGARGRGRGREGPRGRMQRRGGTEPAVGCK